MVEGLGDITSVDKLVGSQTYGLPQRFLEQLMKRTANFVPDRGNELTSNSFFFCPKEEPYTPMGVHLIISDSPDASQLYGGDIIHSSAEIEIPSTYKGKVDESKLFKLFLHANVFY